MLVMEKQYKAQKNLLAQGKHKSISERKKQLDRLYACISENQAEITEALYQDLGKSAFESYATEIGFVLDEISTMKTHLKAWASPRKVRTNQIINFWSKSKIMPEPYGQVLIISPWNYPLNLSIAPLAAALAAGNLVFMKPSEFSEHTSALMEKLFQQYFPEHTVCLFNGGPEVSQNLLALQWDFIFFTGSPRIGKIVMQAAANHVTPVCLELGGKSPVYIDEMANIPLAAKRIAYGKLLNSGQTCIAPDHVYVHESVSSEFIEEIQKKIKAFWGENPKEHQDYPKIINSDKTERLLNLLEDTNAVCVGESGGENHKINPHLVIDCPENHPLMQEEIFGPILPIISVKSPDIAIEHILTRPKPLALYVFAKNKRLISRFLHEISSGGVCINDTIMHITNPRLPFGGVGNSGMGAYHGKTGFETFSHLKSVMKKANFVDPALRYPPFTKQKLKLAKWVLK
jgi:aldehyde dehydrogenase (NAD+)